MALLLWLPLQAAPLQWPIHDEVLDQTAGQMRALCANATSLRIDGMPLAMPELTCKFYQRREFRSIWLSREGILTDAIELVRVVKRADGEGLPVADYPVSLLEKILAGTIEGPRQLAQLDALLTDTFLDYSRDVRSGRVGPRRVGGSWQLPYTPYDGSALLAVALTEHSLSKALAELPPPHAGYLRLRAALQSHRAIASRGGWSRLSARDTLELGSNGPQVVELRDRLRQSGDLPDEPVAEPERFDDALAEAVRHFQHRHGLQVDGRAGKRTLALLNQPVETTIRQIEANMERWRWMPRELAGHRIQVNLAGYELEVIQAGAPVMNMRVIVGRNYRQTPVFASELTHVLLNPYWYVPQLIFREDILPALRRDPERFKRLNMRLLDNGSEVDARAIDWSQVDAHSFPYTLRQEPGPQNALGRIKFLLPNDLGIFLHDTPDRHLFERTSRAFSSGCIRLEQPLELAQHLLADPGQWSASALWEAIEAGKQLSLPVPAPVPIYFTYWTAWVDQAGVLQLRDDIYHRDRRLLKLWGKNAT